ncbi:caspase family protein [Gaetbulibacter aestuarii]|uniref:Caspase family protein n=1 Tax=Gaetbulibacter aestuarii TaxID=1502358 RepID=A0ABW7N1I2_9FLAO
MKIKLTLALFLFFLFVKAQESNTVKVNLKDYHSAKITDAVLSKDESYFISSDESGKVLMFKTKDYSYYKTIREGHGIPVKSLRLIVNDSILLFQQKYSFADGKTDSLFGVRLYDNKTVLSRKLTGDFVGNQDEFIIGASKNNSGIYVLEAFNTRFQPITKAFSSKHVSIASLSYSKTLVGFVTDTFGTQEDLVLVDTAVGKEIIETKIPENLNVLHLFFNKLDNQLFALTVDSEKNILSIFNLSKQKQFVNPVWETSWPYGRQPNIEAHYSGNQYRMIISSDLNMPVNPLVVNFKNNTFSEEVLKLRNGSHLSLEHPKKNDILFFPTFMSVYNSTVGFNVYNTNAKRVIDSFPKGNRKFYSGTFLPQNYWMILGRALNTSGIVTHFEPQIKLYEAGTFNNRFGKLSYQNYLEAKHDMIELPSQNFMFDKHTGIHPFYGYKKEGTENVYAFYKYDLIHDKITKIADEITNERTLVDYNNPQNMLLLSMQRYNNSGYVEPQEFVILKNEKPTKLNGLYKFGKFSVDGNYLLTVNKDNKIKVYQTKDLKQVFEEQLTEGTYSLFNMDATNFAVSNKYQTISLNSCNEASIIIAQDSITGKYKSQKMDCTNIKDLSYSNDKTAIILENFGLILNNKTFRFETSEFPENVSLNTNGTKVMLSFNNGKIVVYDSETFEPLGTTIQPDLVSHVFLSSEGYYFSNTNPEDYLIATSGGQSVPLQEVEKDYFKPEKVLGVFGEPNKDYVAVLKKAMQLKTDNYYNSSPKEDLITDTKKETFESGPGDLYVLSIGVSDYKQSNFNLTYADKDALDMAKIYGALDDETIKNYKTKFFGKQYNLTDSNYNVQASLKKYSEQFKSIGDLRCLSTDANYWLENDFRTYSLWIFKDKTTIPFNMPQGFEEDTYTSAIKTIFIHPDNTGFYIKSKDSIYFYNFVNKTFQTISLPFNDFQYDNTVPLTNDRWLHFEVKSDGLTNQAEILIAKNNASEIDQKITVNLDEYYEETTNNQPTLKSENQDYGYSFKATSSNGKHIIYSSLNDNVYYLNLNEQKIIPYKTRTNNDFDKYGDIYLSEDGSQFSVVSESSGDSKFEIRQYYTKGGFLKTITLNDDDELNLKAIACFNNDPRWIKASAALVEEEFLDSNNLLAENQPFSFKKTFVKHLTNADASSTNIKTTLKNFFNQAKPNDQVLVFLAGHGVLDKDLNYYFAPYDMDFNAVTKYGVSLNTIVESLKVIPSKNKLLLMDSCHSGNTLDMDNSGTVIVNTNSNLNQRGSKAKSTSKNSDFKVSDVISTLFEDFLSTSGITIVSASSGEDVAYENKAIGNGAFTSAYIKLLKKELMGNGYIIDESNLKQSIDLNNEVIEALMKDVMIITNGKQVPDLRELNKSSHLKMW